MFFSPLKKRDPDGLDHQIPEGYSVQGLALVCRNETNFAGNRETPPELWSVRDWEFFQNALDRSCCTVMPLDAHRQNPNIMRRKRLVVTSLDAGLVCEDEVTVLWDPSRVLLQDALHLLCEGEAGLISVCGDQDIFRLFFSIGIGRFYLTRIYKASLIGGQKLFPDGSLEKNLHRLGYRCMDRTALDDKSEEILETWEPEI